MSEQKMNVAFALQLLAQGGNGWDGKGALYMEVGRYKPWSMPVINALRRRGYRVDGIDMSRTEFLLHPKQQTKEQGK